MHAIIGSGISGSMRLHLDKNAICFDKARYPGGRTSTKPFESNYTCDIGATFFKESCYYRLNQRKQSFSCLDFLRNLNLECIQYQYTNFRSTYYSKNGLQRISEKLVENKEIHFAKELISFEILEDQKFLLHFLDGSNFTVDHLTITSPLPQAMAVFPNSKEKEAWESFLQPFYSYRKTLVAAGFWKAAPEQFMQAMKKLPKKTFLFPNEETEYISIESLKTGGDGFVFMVQYSSQFSDLQFNNWRMEDRSPTDFCKRIFSRSFLTFLNNHSLREYWDEEDTVQPNLWRIHKWRYAQAENPMLSKYDDLDFDSDIMKEYTDLVRSTNIRLTGDWVFGPRIERLIAGESLWKDPRPSLNGEF